MSAAKLLDRLERVKKTGPGRWFARCPAHQDYRPSLSVRELDDGRVLIYDFGGCETGEVLAAIGLNFTDLFEKALGNLRPSHARIPAHDLLQVISEETTVVAIIASDMREHRTISEADWARLSQAAARIARVRDHVC